MVSIRKIEWVIIASMTLLEIGNDETVRIIKLKGGRHMSEKLRNLALFPGTVVKVIRYAPFGGPVMIEVEGRTLALGRGIAHHIVVERI